jgi:2-keto-4-pentenoate hydratase
MVTFNDLVEHISQPRVAFDPALDITKLKPDITQQEALAVQLAVKRRRVAEGDSICGHQASFTSAGVRKLFPGSPRPMVGTVLASQMRADGDEVPLDGSEMFIESEMGLILKRDLEGPDLSPLQVLAAVEGFFPAIEVVQVAPGIRESAYSYAHLIAVQKDSAGFFVVGSRITPARNFDPRLEGCLVNIDGAAKAGATGFEAMGNPLSVVAAMARGLCAIGEKLCAGQLIFTGSLAPQQIVTRDSRIAQLDFQTLGSVSVRLRAD